MRHGERGTGGEDGEGRVVLVLGSLVEGVLDLRTNEARASTRVRGDGEGVGRERVQDATGIVDELEGLVTSVGDGRGDLQVLDAINRLGTGDLEGEAGGRRDSDRGSRKGDEGGTEGGGEHLEARQATGEHGGPVMESIAAQCQVIYLDDIWSNCAGIEARVAKLVLPQKDKEETHAQHM